MSSIPVIDFSPICNTDCDTVDQEAKDQVFQQINQACKDIGFFYLTGHGVEQSAVDQLCNAQKSLFALPLQKKYAMGIHNSPSYTGYTATKSEKTQNVIDIREGYWFYPDLLTNQIPEEKDLPGFADIVTTYTEQVNKLGFIMMQALAVGLGLSENFFDEQFSRPTLSAIALWHYPPHPADTESWGVAPHTDYGLCTFVMQDDIGGLEVETTEGQWIDVKPIPGTLVVNLGDALVGWTKGLYRAAKHRVRRSINTDRYSAPFFFNPNADCLIEPIDTNATKDLTYTKVVQGLEMPFRFSDLKMSLLRKSFDWSKDLSPNTLTEK